MFVFQCQFIQMSENYQKAPKPLTGKTARSLVVRLPFKSWVRVTFLFKKRISFIAVVNPEHFLHFETGICGDFQIKKLSCS